MTGAYAISSLRDEFIGLLLVASFSDGTQSAKLGKKWNEISAYSDKRIRMVRRT
jgi:hypothetical protein